MEFGIMMFVAGFGFGFIANFFLAEKTENRLRKELLKERREVQKLKFLDKL